MSTENSAYQVCSYVLDNGRACCWCAMRGTPATESVGLRYPENVLVEHLCCAKHAGEARRLHLPEQHSDAIKTEWVRPLANSDHQASS